MPSTWVKPADDESVESVFLLRRAFEAAHAAGWTDERIALALSRPGRHLSVHTVRAWRETHRPAMVHFGDVVRMVMVLPEEVGRVLAEGFAAAAGMMAIDLPEPAAGPDAVGRAALDVGVECGELQAAVLEAAADGEISQSERRRIAAEASDVARSAAWCGRCAREE